LGDEAEVDFGTASVYLAGVLTEVQLFIMRLSRRDALIRGPT